MPSVLPSSHARRRLLEKYLSGTSGQSPKLPSIVRGRHSELAPLSFAQEDLWRREFSAPEGPPLFNECITVHMRGPIDVAALEASYNEIVRRHEAWRTTFESRDGRLVQVVQPATHVKLPLVDLRTLPRASREQEALCIIGKDAQRPFNLARGPLLRPIVVRMDDEEYKLFLIAHQIIVDGISAYQVFPSELATIYKAEAAGKGSPLPELPVQYADFARWQRECLPGEAFPKQIAYWRRQLPVLSSPVRLLSERRPNQRRFSGALQSAGLPGRLAEQLREFARCKGATLFMTLLAGFAWVLHDRTGLEEIVLSTPSPSGRKRSEVSGLLGYFLNSVPLRVNFSTRPSFSDLLRQVRTVVSEAISNDDLPTSLLARELNVETDGHNPFLSVGISLQPSTPSLELDWNVTSMDVDSGGTSWDFYLAFIDRPDGMLGRAQYNSDLFDAEAITAILNDLQTSLEAGVLKPEAPLSSLRRESPRSAGCGPASGAR